MGQSGGFLRNTASAHTLQHIATHCNTLQHIATHCNTPADGAEWRVPAKHRLSTHTATHCNTLQHIATHCNTLQHTATHLHMGQSGGFLQSTASAHTLQHTATHCNTLQYTATHCNTLRHTCRWGRVEDSCEALLQHIHCTFQNADTAARANLYPHLYCRCKYVYIHICIYVCVCSYEFIHVCVRIYKCMTLHIPEY